MPLGCDGSRYRVSHFHLSALLIIGAGRRYAIRAKNVADDVPC